MKNLICLILITIWLPNGADATTRLKVGLIEDGRPPYFFVSDGKYRGIYIDFLTAIEQQTDIKFDYLSYPQARLRALMLSNHLDVEPGIDMTWRTEPFEQINSVYSMPFMYSTESWVMKSSTRELFNTGQKIGKSLKPCSVLGFNVANEIEDEDIDIKTNGDEHMLKLIAKGRCGIAVIPDDILRYYKIFQQPEYYVVPASNNHALRLRLSARFEHLVPVINNIIGRLETSGEMQEILSKYTVNQ